MTPEVDFLVATVKAIVEHPEDVRIERSVDEMGVLLTLFVNPSDMGQVIGRQGATAQAIRTVTRVIGMKHQSRVNVKIDDPRAKSIGTRKPTYGVDL